MDEERFFPKEFEGKRDRHRAAELSEESFKEWRRGVPLLSRTVPTVSLVFD